jgi:hypothetical protein
MKTLFKLFILMMLVAGTQNSTFAQSPSLSIHHIGAGDGDATLIIVVDSIGINQFTGQQNWDTCVILIDGQRYGSSGKMIWKYVKDTVGTLFPTRKIIDHVIVSHLHIDHYGGIPAFLKEAQGEDWTIGDLYDRQYVNYKNYYAGAPIIGECYDTLSTVNPDGPSFTKYQQAVVDAGLSPTQNFQIGENLLPGYKTAYMFCVVGYGITNPVNLDRDTCFLPVKQSGSKYYYESKSENDLSTGFLIRFQGFNYLTCGDLGGISGGNYVDGETPMTKGIMSGLRYPADYHICANKVSHHGSEESTTDWFAETNDFTVSVFPACLRSYGSSPNALPTETAIMNLVNTERDTLFYTFVPKNPGTQSSYWTKGDLDYYNDVVIKFTAPPGYGDVVMDVIERKKTKKGVYVGNATSRAITCDKGHKWF